MLEAHDLFKEFPTPAGALQILGVELGSDLLPPIEDENNKGFFEDRDVVEFHDRLLERFGYTWDYLRRIPPEPLTSQDTKG